MKVLFTGFTSRTVGSERNVYDYMSNVFVLQRALELAGHVVDARPVSLESDPVIEEDYDCAVVGVAAANGLSSRFKVGALWALHRFGKRAAIFPSDGRNVYIFPNSVASCLTGNHALNGTPIAPLDYMLGALMKEKNNIIDARLAASHPSFRAALEAVMFELPHDVNGNSRCRWPVLVPTHSWGNPTVYQRHFGGPTTCWDPTNVAIPMQFDASQLTGDGRLAADMALVNAQRERAWVLSTLQDQDGWLKKQKCKWPIVTIGNKRKAAKGGGLDYVPEAELIREYYSRYWGHLAFGYPLAEGGWWRMRYVHAALAGIVTCCDEADARRMPESYRHSRIMLERWSDDKLGEIAWSQHRELMDTAWSSDRAVAAVDAFVRGLA